MEGRRREEGRKIERKERERGMRDGEREGEQEKRNDKKCLKATFHRIVPFLAEQGLHSGWV